MSGVLISLAEVQIRHLYRTNVPGVYGYIIMTPNGFEVTAQLPRRGQSLHLKGFLTYQMAVDVLKTAVEQYVVECEVEVK